MARSVLSLLNKTPVPLASSTRQTFSPSLLQKNSIDTFIRAYSESGTVFSTVSLLAENVAATEWRMYRTPTVDGRVRYTTNDRGSDMRTEVLQHQAMKLLNNPNNFFTGFSLMELSQTYLELTGESWWVLNYDNGLPFPTGIWPVHPGRMQPVPSPVDYLHGYLYTSPDGEIVPLSLNEVISVKYPNPADPYRGQGAIEPVLTDIDSSKYSAEWNRNFFLNGAMPGGIIEVDGRLSDEEWQELVSRFRETHRGVGRAHRVATLEQGATWVQTSMSQKDMDFANLRSISGDAIREAYRMHKVMVGISDDVNRANAQTGEEVFGSWQVRPRLNRWRDALNNQFLPLFGSTGTGVEFDYVPPTANNREQDNEELTAKANAALALIQAGYDPAGVLETVGLPAIETAAVQLSEPSAPPAPDSSQATSPSPSPANTGEAQ